MAMADRMRRSPGLSVRVKLTFSYLVVLVAAEVLLLATVWLFLLRYVPADATASPAGYFPGRDDLVRAFTPAALWATLASLAFGAVGGWLLAGRMLSPLDRITAATRAASRGSLSHRIELGGRTDEFRELADSFDAMLERLEAHVDEQRRFAANASHELRTPLAVTQAVLEVAENDPDAELAELIPRLRTVNTRAIELTEALLMLSRAESGGFVSERVDLSLAAEQSVETLLSLAERAALEVILESGAAVTCGSSSLLQQMVTNLLHNAIVHNLSAGGFVRLTTLTDARWAYVVVENSGERVSDALLASAAEPFRRGTDRIRGDQVGAGLGLAIVQSIVRAHFGELHLSARVEGGLRVVVRLRRAGPA